MSDLESLPEDWTVWNEAPGGRIVLAYRPDVFDSEAFPAACLPTLYLTQGRHSDRRPGPERRGADQWFVTLYLEPEVSGPERRFETRDAAIEGAVDLATQFAAGDLDYRELYQVPREAYLDKLDELTGRN